MAVLIRIRDCGSHSVITHIHICSFLISDRYVTNLTKGKKIGLESELKTEFWELVR